MSNFHFHLSLKLPQGEVHDLSGEVHSEVAEILRGGANTEIHVEIQNIRASSPGCSDV
jgi:hypothetical protein